MPKENFDIQRRSSLATQLVKDETLSDQDRFLQIARQHGLDPRHIETWPKEIKDQLKEEA